MTSVTQREYSALLAERPPRVLRSRAEYDGALEEIDHLMVRGEQRTKPRASTMSSSPRSSRTTIATTSTRCRSSRRWTSSRRQ